MSYKTRAIAVMCWGAGSIVLSLFDAIARLSKFVIEGVHVGLLRPSMIGLTVAWCVVIVYYEGVRAFGQALAPRIAARLWSIAARRQWLAIALAPLHALSLFDSNAKRVRVSWLLLAFVVTMILFVRKLPQPYRASIDLGVVLALSYGSYCIVRECVLALKNSGGRVDPELGGA
jgi:hypothetical protein